MAARKTKVKAPARLDRERIVDVALKLIDDVGLDGLTIRRLAEELGVQNPALYWHFRDKQEIVDCMAERMMRATTAEPLDGEPWRRWLERAARTFRGVLRGHRDGARILASADLSGSSMWPGFERAVQQLVKEGLPARDALIGIVAMYDYTLGATFEEQTDPARNGRETPKAIPTVALGLFAATVGTLKDSDDTFEGGLALLLDGLASRVVSTRARR